MQEQSSSISQLEGHIHGLGWGVGRRLLDLVGWRDKGGKHEVKLLNMLGFLQTNVWKAVTGRAATSLEKGLEAEDEYMINDSAPPLTEFISMPRDLAHFCPGVFLAGVVSGVLDSANFPARVTAHLIEIEGQETPRTTVLIKFSNEVMERERMLT